MIRITKKYHNIPPDKIVNFINDFNSNSLIQVTACCQLSVLETPTIEFMGFINVSGIASKNKALGQINDFEYHFKKRYKTILHKVNYYEVETQLLKERTQK